jgi:hypothetical protein
MMQGFVTPGSSATGFYVSSFLQGNASRYYRANQLGTYCRTSGRSRRLSLTAAFATTGTAASRKSTGASSTSIPRSTATTWAPTRFSQSGLIIAGNNANGTKGVSNTRSPAASGALARASALRGSRDCSTASGRPRGRRHVLRPRRTVQLLLARLRHRHRHRRTLRRQPATAVRECHQLPLPRSIRALLPTYEGYIPHLRRFKRTPQAISRIPTAHRCCRRRTIPRPPISANYLPNAGSDSERRPTASSSTASLSRWASTTAPTSCPTP